MDINNSIARLASAQRILVLGSSGSGKTTFAIRLGQILNIEPIHLDACFWKPGWVNTPKSEWREIVSSLVQQDSWIMDGTYESTLDIRIPAADAIILIDRSRWGCLWRILKRKATVDDLRRPDAVAGQKLDLAFLRYIWQYPKVTQPFVFDEIRRFGPQKMSFVVHSSTQIERLLRDLQRTVGQPDSTDQTSPG
jgi:adenylate kinase family enzyme